MKENTDDSTQSKSDHHPSRRSFLKTLWVILGIAAAAELIYVVIGFLHREKSKDSSQNNANIIEAGHVDSFPINSVTANIQGKFYLCRMKDGGFLALSSKCTHLGCTVPWDDKENKFICPCHGSTFDITGNVITSPAPRPLDIYPVYMENSIIKVDTGKSIKRGSFSREQLLYAKKVQI